MRAPTDLPRRRPRPSGRRIGLLILAGIALVLLLSLRGIAGFYTDYLWFDALGLNKVWSGVLGAKVGLAVVFTLLFFVVLFANMIIADRLAPPFRPPGPEEDLVERYREIVGERAGLVRLGVAGLFALVAGIGTSGQWNSWILFRNSVPFAGEDPQFHTNIDFYVFRLPFMSFVVEWAFASLVFIVVVTAVVHYLNGGIRLQVPGAQRVTPQVKAHLSVLLGVLALLKAAGYWLQRYELNFSTRGYVDGAGYTDVKAQLPALNLLVIISLAAAVLLLVNIRLRGFVLPIIAVGLWAFTSVVVGAAYPWFIQKFRVEPNQSAREEKYIDRNIQATRAAFNLGGIEVRDFEYNERLNAENLRANATTIRNVRLWDPKVLEETYRQLQLIRRFYTFNDIDIDRYDIDGETNQVVLSARELSIADAPASWENRHLNFTHGYGVVASPANAVTPEGLPDFLLKDLPPTGHPELLGAEGSRQPAIYFGQGLTGYAIVGTERDEIDFQRADGSTQRTKYKGKGGVKISGWIRRAAFALRFGDINPLFSSYLTGESRAIYIRDIRDRVRKVAPFLRYDSDPYPVLLDGKVSWIIDAYTVTNRYPYAQRADDTRVPDGSGLRGRFNYVRNSVKVEIDAYDGEMTFWVIDEKDPVVRAYQKAFPKLFTAGSGMSPDLRAHLRYPEDLFRVQTNAFGLYHITDAKDFYDRGDAWDIARDPGSGQLDLTAPVPAATATTTAGGGVPLASSGQGRQMDPYYLQMRLPGEQNEDFLLLQPFTPASRDLLSAFVVAKSDPDDYGKLQAYVMPRNLTVPGPRQIDAKVRQDPIISPQLTLLDQRGSQVIQGSLLLIPIEQSLLYIRPLYVQAETTKLPELQKVIVVFGEKVVMADSLREALIEIFGDAPETQERQGGGAPNTPPPGTPPTTPGGAELTEVEALLNNALAAYARAQEALRKGDLSGYQQAIDEMRRLVEQARTEASGEAPPVTTSTTQPPAQA